MKRCLFGIVAFIVFSWSIPKLEAQVNFTGPELLGKPTNESIAVNVVPDANIELYYEYGTTQGGPYTGQTTIVSVIANHASEVVINELNSNTLYYYRMQYRTSGGSWTARTEHTFHTQRATGSTYVFTITSDSHAQMNTAHQQAMQNINSNQPDFNLDIGDTFMPDGTTSQSAVDTKYMAYRASLYMGAIGHSVPIFLSSGNHENEEGWNFDDTPFSIALGSVQARKMYYPTPIQNGFYSGNTNPLAAIDEGTYGDEYREDYYAWEWGDALFVVIDPFQYTMNLPYTPTAGEGNDDTVTGDQWSWTLGAQQFNWFKQTIQNSHAKYKFVFSHQMVGGIPRNASGGAGYVRGGAEAAAYFEWGGNNADGTAGFAGHRNSIDFGTTPIHQLMVENGVSAYFHGHDHQFVYETRDGIVYQEVPSPSMSGSGFSGIYTEGDHGSYNTIRILPNSGHLRVTITPAQATVDYVRSNQTGVSYTYTIEPNTPSTTYDLTMAVDPVGGGTTNPSVGVHTYNEDTEVTLTATPASGYVFDHWSGDATGSVNPTSVTMDGNKSVTAHFTAIPTYDLTMAVDPVGGGTTNPSVGVHTYNEDTEVTLTATPASGYVFDHWSGDATGSVNPTSVTMDGNKSVTAHFTAIPTYDLAMAVDPAGGGTTNPSVGVHTYNEDTEVTLTATPAIGYVFDHWSGDATGSVNPTSVTMDGNKSVTAHFTAIPTYDLTMAVDPAGGGTTNPSVGVHPYNEDTEVTLTATPASGYVFDHWSGDLAGSTNPTSITMNGDKSVTAHFSEATPSPLTLDGAVSSGTADDVSSISITHTTGTGTNRLMLVGVSWNCGTTDRTISSVTFTPSGGSAVGLTEVITQLGYNTSNPRYSAIYRLLNPTSGQAGTVTITFSGSVSNGIVAGVANFAGVNQTTPFGTPIGTASSGNDTAPTVTLTGLNGNELVFDNVFQGASSESQTLTAGSGQTQLWTGFAGNTRASASTKQATGSSVTMSWTAASASYWAIAAVPINPSTTTTTYDLTLAVSPTAGGTTDPSVGAHTYLEAAVVNITATPTVGYVFDHWSGDLSGSANPSSITMDADKSVTAVFVVNSATSAATPSNATPSVSQQIVVSISVDMTHVVAADNKLGSFTGSLVWNPAVLAYASHSGLLAGFIGAVNTTNVNSGRIDFNGANATGTTGNFVVFQITFNVVGTGTSALDLEYSAMAAASTFANLLPILTVTDGQIVASSGILGDINDDDLANSTDALIILSGDVGINVSQFCPMNCGDVNNDGLVNSTDALIILSYDVGMSVPFPVGQSGCPGSVTPPPGCNP